MLKQFHHTALTFILLCCFITISAQTDSLILKNGDVIVGEIKSMDKGVVTIETDYSKDDFTIEWSGIKEVYSSSRFLITLKDGRRINGSFKTIDSGNIQITGVNGEKIDVRLSELVYLKEVESKFWSRMRASIDLGYNFTKANNLKQFSTRSTLGYLADKWSVDLYYNDINSSQDSIEPTKRTEAGINYKYFLQRDWFLMADLAFLSNTEQALKLRTNGKLGAGNYILHTNKSYLAAGGGISFNNETFSNETEKRNSAEAYAGTEWNRFDKGDLDVLSSIYIYPSLTEKGRFRSDIKVDVKYDLPLDFYIKSGLTLNYDNRPAIAGNETDYVFVVSFGWEL